MKLVLLRIIEPIGAALLCGIVLLLCVAAVIAESEPDTEPQGNANNESELIQALRAFEKQNAEINDLSARFSQKRYSPLLKKPIASSGIYRSIAGLARWDTQTPHDSAMVIQTDRLEIYYPDQNTLEVYPIEQRLGDLLASPQPDVDQWLASFKLGQAMPEALSEPMREAVGIKENADDYLLISLTPREEEIAKLIARLVVVVDKKTGLSRAMAWSSKDGGERTEIVFDRVRLNTQIKRADLLLDLPDTTKVVYPLGPVGEPEKKTK